MNTFIKPNGGSVAHAPNAIEVEHIVKKYGDFTAVNDVSFTVKEGEIFGLLGPNGAGKSTLIRMMTTLLPITAGVAHIGGYDVSRDPNQARNCMGVIPQAMTSDLDLTVYENMSIHGKLVALDTPNALKQTVPGSNVIEAQFGNAPDNWEQLLQGFPDVRNVQAQ